MTKRKYYLIDKKFQLKTALSIIGFSSVAVIITLVLIGYIITYNNTKLENIIQIENNVVDTLLTLSQDSQDNALKITINNAAGRHYSNIEAIKSIISLNTVFVICLIIIAIINYIFLFFILIKKTHKISGPAFVMTNYIKAALKGEEPKIRQLRKDDELSELHGELVKLLEHFRNT